MATGASAHPRRFQFRIWDLLHVTTLVAIILAMRRIDLHRIGIEPYIPYAVLGAELLAVVGLTSAFTLSSPGNRLSRMAIRGVLASTFLSPLCLWLPTVFVLGPMFGPTPRPALLLVVAIAIGPLLGVLVGLITWWLYWRSPWHWKYAFTIPAASTAAIDPDWLRTSLGENARVTDRVRLIVQLAAGDAVRDGCEQVEPRHLLLAIAEESRGVAAFILKQQSVSVQDVRRAMRQHRATRRRGAQVTVPIISLSNRAKCILRDAEVEASKLAHGYVGSEHLLLALTRRGEGTILALGLTLERVRRELLALLGNTPR